MGSTNPVFILPGALKERGETIAQALVGSVTLGVGQFCTNPGLVFLIKEGAANDVEAFIKKTAEALSAVPAGTMLTGKIKEAYDAGIETLGRIQGVTVAARGKVGEGSCCGVPHLLRTTAGAFMKNPQLSDEVFGPSTLVVTAADKDELLKAAFGLNGHLTATIHCAGRELEAYAGLAALLETKVGRLIINGFPTGVEVCPSMFHGGPYPATTDVHFTSVGTAAIRRFARPICYQDFPQDALPDQLKDDNPLNIFRLFNREWLSFLSDPFLIRPLVHFLREISSWENFTSLGPDFFW